MKPKSNDLLDLASSGCSSLHVIACTDNVSQIFENKNVEKDLISSALQTDYLGNTPLHYAACNSSYKVAEFLLTVVYSNSLKNVFGLNPCHFAAEIGDTMMLHTLEKSKAMLDEITYCGWLPLHFAVYFNHLDCVKLLVNHNPKSINSLITTIDRSLTTFPENNFAYKSPLDIAIIKNHKEIQEYLESMNALPEMHAAVATHNLQAITYYLSKPELKEKHINLQYGKKQITPLHIAAVLGDAQVSYTLIFAGSSPSIKDIDGFSALELAVMSQSRMCVRVIAHVSDAETKIKAAFLAATLKNEDICIELSLKETCFEEEKESGDSLLMKFIKGGFVKAASRLVTIGADLMHKNKEGATCLHVAATMNATSILQNIILSPNGKELINAKDNNKRTPLMYAILNSSIDAAKILLKNNASFNEPDKFGMTPFALSTAIGFFMEGTKIESFSEIYTIDFANLYKSLILHEKEIKRPTYGIKENINLWSNKFSLINEDLLKKIKEASEIFPVLKEGTIFHVAITMKASVETIQEIMSPARHLVETPDGNGMFPILTAALTNSMETLLFFLKANSNVKVHDKNGNGVFHYLTDDSMIESVKYIYENYTTIPNFPNNDGDYPMHITCRKNASQIVKLHIEHIKAEEIVNMINKDGETPIDCAIKAEAIECINVLYSKGIKNPLIEAVCQGDKEKVIYLLSHGFSIESTDSEMMTPLHHAAEMGDAEMVKLLLDKGANRHALSKIMYTPLHYAAKSGNKNVCLLIGSIPLNSVNADYKNQPYYICENKDTKKLLFRMWKRAQLAMELSGILLQYRPSLVKGIEFVKEIISNDKTSFDDVLKIYIQKGTDFLAIIDRFSSYILTPNAFIMPIHHFLMQFAAFSSREFAESFISRIAELVTLKGNKDKTSTYIIFYFTDFLHYIALTGKYLNVIHQFPVFEYDNKALTDRAHLLIKSNKEVASETISRLRSIIMQILRIPVDIQGYLMFVSTTVISDISYSPITLMNDDFTETFQRVFNTRSSMPRTLPFVTHQKITIFAISDIIFFSGGSKNFAIPKPLVYARSLNRNNEILVSTPVCSFKLQFLEEHRTGNEFLMFVNARSMHSSITIKGISGLEDKDTKKKTFECIVAYQVPMRKTVTIRMMTIVAGTSDACYDIARTYVKETDSSQLLFFTVTTHECKEDLIVL